MNQQQFDAIKAMVLSMLRLGEYQQALGMLQGAGIVADVGSHMAEWEQMYSWGGMAGECAIDRKFDDMQHQEWHDTQSSLEESVR